MFGNEIINKFKYVPNFGGVLGRDQLPDNVSLPIGMIVNTDKHYEAGAHWVAIYIDSNGIGEYFDSFGLPPLYEEMERFLINNTPNGYFYNNITLQCLDCVTCGEYCVAYLICRLCENISYADYISLFTSNPIANDELIKIFYSFID